MTDPPPDPSAGEKERENEPSRPLGGGCGADPEAKVDFRQLPRLIREGLSTIWEASRRDLVMVLILQLFGGVDVVALLILGRNGLEQLLGAAQSGGTLAAVTPWALGLAGLIALNLIMNSVQQQRQQVLGELVMRHVQERILEVTTRVELDAFDTPDFHNRAQQIQSEGHRPLELVWGLTGLAQGLIGVLGVLIAFITVAPLVIPLLALVAIPVWLGASRRSQLFYRFV